MSYSMHSYLAFEEVSAIIAQIETTNDMEALNPSH